MASKSERLIAERFGCPRSDDGGKVAFTDSTASGVLIADTTYRVTPDADCHVKLDDRGEAADSNDMYMVSGVTEYFTTTASDIVLHAIGKSPVTAGNLYYTPMKSRGK